MSTGTEMSDEVLDEIITRTWKAMDAGFDGDGKPWVSIDMRSAPSLAGLDPRTQARVPGRVVELLARGTLS